MNFDLIDTHTHLYLPEFDRDRETLIEKAKFNGVKEFYLPNIENSSIASMLDLESRMPGTCFAMMGLHPCSVKENFEEELGLVRSWLDKRKFVGIGEIGLDLYWDKSFFPQQEIALRMQLDWALEFDYPVSIHCREAFDELYSLLCTYARLPRGVFHCFTGTAGQAAKVLELGTLKLGIGGVVTFKNGGLDKVLPTVPLEQLVLETDAPYLAPVPYRGKRNEPAYILEVAKKVAEIKNISVQEVAEATSRTSRELFRRA